MSEAGPYLICPMDTKTFARFSKKVRVDQKTKCWEWAGAKNNHGYGQLRLSPTKLVLAHRLAYVHYVGPIGDGLQLDHHCCNPGCVNPDHLEAVTQSVNLARAFAAPTRERVRKARA